MKSAEGIQKATCRYCGIELLLYKRGSDFVCAGCHPLAKPPRRRVVEITSVPKKRNHRHV